MPSRRLSQVFLKNESVIHGIMEHFSPTAEDIVLEIGPGDGALSDYIVQKVKQFIAIEIDADLADALARRYEKYPNARVIREDFLKVDFKKIFSEDSCGKIRLISNLPYHIASPSLFYILNNYSLFKDATLMLQREVARRILGADRKERGVLKILAHCRAKISSVMRVSPNAFRPMPRVGSEVLYFEFFRKPPFKEADETEFWNMLATAFVARRKTLWNNLKCKYSTETMENAWSETKFLKNIRAEALPTEDFVKLYNALTRRKG